MNKELYIHELKLPESNEFSKQFNICSDWFIKSQDQNLSEEERAEALKAFWLERCRLETGGY